MNEKRIGGEYEILCAGCGQMSAVGTHDDEDDGSLCPECEKHLAESELAWKTRKQIDEEKGYEVTDKETNSDVIACNA